MGSAVVKRTMTKMYDAQWFLDHLAAIPARLWCVDKFTDDAGRHCAIGHIDEYGDSSTAEKLRKLGVTGDDCCGGFNGGTADMADVNNGNHPRYQQKTPRARTLARLRDAIREGL
jgi:hypothetical protein